MSIRICRTRLDQPESCKFAPERSSHLGIGRGGLISGQKLTVAIRLCTSGQAGEAYLERTLYVQASLDDRALGSHASVKA